MIDISQVLSYTEISNTYVVVVTGSGAVVMRTLTEVTGVVLSDLLANPHD